MINSRRTSIQWLVCISLFSIFIIASCTHNQSAPIVQPQCIIPGTVSFKNDVVPVFEISCDQPMCHSGTESKGRVNLEPDSAYYNLFKDRLIDTLNPTQSQLYQRLVSTSSPMPPGIYLDNCTIKTILTWIEQGAKNN